MRSRFYVGVVAFLLAGTAAWWFTQKSSRLGSASPIPTPAQEVTSAGRGETNESAILQTPSESPKGAQAASKTSSTGATAPVVSTAPTAPAPTAPAPAVPAPVVVADTCTTQIFTHHSAEGHEDGEACLYHKNLIHLTGLQGEINPKSLCVRANNKPVKFKFVAQKQGPQILLGAVAGPKTQISVTYCTGRMTCASDCTVPKDDFMEAIGAAETDEDLFTDRGSKVGWKKGKNPQKEEEAVQRELAELKKTVKDELKKGSLFEGWDTGTSAPAVCGRSRASK